MPLEFHPDCYCCRIDLWLHNCAVADTALNASTRENHAAATSHPMVAPNTPPATSQGRSGSPSKRRRTDSSQADDAPPADADLTPRPADRQPFSRPLVLLPDGTSTSDSHAHAPSRGFRTRSTGSGFSPTRKKRPTSPVKRPIQMLSLAKPIRMLNMSGDEAELAETFPPEMLELYRQLQHVAVYSHKFVPCEAREAIGRAFSHQPPWPAHLFFDSGRGKEAVEAELASLNKIVEASLECESEEASEVAWNTVVHYPMLELAAAGWRVKPLVVATARVDPDWQPLRNPAVFDAASAKAPTGASASTSSASQKLSATDGGGGSAASRMLDLALVLNESRKTPLGSAIIEALSVRGSNDSSINQSSYGPLMFRPMGVGIETKVRSSPVDGRVQLAIWTSAWFSRMRAFVSEESADGMPTTLPVILVTNHFWALSFVRDRGDRFDFFHDIAIGDTKTLLGSYKLLASLRVLIQWMDTDFRAFFNNLFGVN